MYHPLPNSSKEGIKLFDGIVVQNLYLAYKDGKVLDLGKFKYLPISISLDRALRVCLIFLNM